MRSPCSALLPFALTLLILRLPVAAAPIQTPVPPPKKLTLDQALAALPSADGLLLTVSAEKNTLPAGTEAPPPDVSLDDIAGAFGDLTFNYGSVTALAPSTMVVLNTQPDAPDLAKDINGLTAFNILAASLNDSQWRMLTSEHGLGLTDLSDDTQHGLFHALFSHGQLWIGSEDPELRPLPQEKRTDVRDVTDQIDATRIRLGQMAMIRLHDTEGKSLHVTPDRPDADQRLHTYRPKTPPTPAEHGVTLRASFPNILKPSDLDWDLPRLQVPVPTAGLKTVGDLVAAAARKTGLELYSDPHYALRTLTFIGTVKSEPAADLLRALCLCVTGTFRNLGPAYVLTDDIEGVGARRKILVDWEEHAFQSGTKLQEQAGKSMLAHRATAARRLPSFGDPLALTTDEMASIPDDIGLPGIPSAEGVSYPISKLPAAHQTWVRQMAAAYNAPTESRGSDLPNVDLSHDIGLEAKYCVQMLVPTETRPVDTNLQSPMFMLFYPGFSDDITAAYAHEGAEETAKLPPLPPLSTTLHSGRCRAVIGHPRTEVDVDSLVTAMQKLGLNTLLLEVFSDSVNHLKTHASDGPDILTEALTRTRGTGIAVYADLSLLSWGDAPPDRVRDLTANGRTNREAAIEQDKFSDNANIGDSGKLIPFVAPPIRVSPAAPEVHQMLMALVQNLAMRPGLSGLMWKDADDDDSLGYTPAMRFAFLRTNHADPVDIDAGNYPRGDTSLPLFDDKVADEVLPTQWAEACTKSLTRLLNELYRAARQGQNPALPIFMEQDSFRDHWLASWDDPKLLPPSQRTLSPDEPYAPQDKMMQIARTQGRIILRRESIWNDGDTAALQRDLVDGRKTLAADGYVLDFTNDTVTQGAAPLDSLVRAVSAEKAVK